MYTCESANSTLDVYIYPVYTMYFYAISLSNTHMYWYMYRGCGCIDVGGVVCMGNIHVHVVHVVHCTLYMQVLNGNGDVCLCTQNYLN